MWNHLDQHFINVYNITKDLNDSDFLVTKQRPNGVTIPYVFENFSVVLTEEAFLTSALLTDIWGQVIFCRKELSCAL